MASSMTAPRKRGPAVRFDVVLVDRICCNEAIIQRIIVILGARLITIEEFKLNILNVL